MAPSRRPAGEQSFSLRSTRFSPFALGTVRFFRLAGGGFRRGRDPKGFYFHPFCAGSLSVFLPPSGLLLPSLARWRPAALSGRPGLALSRSFSLLSWAVSASLWGAVSVAAPLLRRLALGLPPSLRAPPSVPPRRAGSSLAGVLLPSPPPWALSASLVLAFLCLVVPPLFSKWRLRQLRRLRTLPLPTAAPSGPSLCPLPHPRGSPFAHCRTLLPQLASRRL